MAKKQRAEGMAQLMAESKSEFRVSCFEFRRSYREWGVKHRAESMAELMGDSEKDNQKGGKD